MNANTLRARLARGYEQELEYEILKNPVSTVWVRRMGTGIVKKWDPVCLFTPKTRIWASTKIGGIAQNPILIPIL